MSARLKYPEDYYRSETNRSEDGPKDSPPKYVPIFDIASPPGIDAAKQPPQAPWRHPRFICPRCTSSQVNRVGRDGLRDHILSLFQIYPFRCESCGHRFRVLERGVRYHRKRNH